MHTGHLSAGDLSRLSQALGALTLDLAGGRLHLLQRPLPEGFPAALVVQDGETWVIVDAAKPHAKRHAWALLREHVLNSGDESGCGQVLQLPSPRGRNSTRLSLVG